MRYSNAILALCIFIASCGQSDTKQQKLNEKDTTSSSANSDNQIQEEQEEKESSNNNNQLTKFFQIEIPNSLEQLKSILGSETKVERESPSGDSYKSSTWELSDSTIIWFDNAQESGTTIEAKGQQIIETPLGISINQSTFDDCKEIIKDIKKSTSLSDDKVETWKFNKGKVWYFLEFNKDKLLKRIKLAAVDLDTVG
jgi:hypothetical protein